MPMAAKKRPSQGRAPNRAQRPASSRRTAPSRAKPQSVTPYLAVRGGDDALAWYKQAFGAKELAVQRTPDGKVMHAALRIGGSQLFLSDEFPGSDVSSPLGIGGTTVNLHVYGKNIDKLWQQAVAAGAKVAMPLENQFWGDRYGKLTDPFGHSWGFSYPAKMTEAEKKAKMEQAMAAMRPGQA